MTSKSILAVLLLSTAFLVGAQTSNPARAQVVGSPWSAEWPALLEHMSLVYLDDGQGGKVKTIRFTGVNLQVVNGLDATNGYPTDPTTTDPSRTRVNGLGNLIVGYNEPGNPNGDDRSGSHNVVFGQGNSFSSFGGAVGQKGNRIAGAFASVTGGQFNQATADGASVSGGTSNTASGYDSSVTGGSRNKASGTSATISGGYQNTATGFRSSVGGGSNRSVSATDDWRAGSLFEDY